MSGYVFDTKFDKIIKICLCRYSLHCGRDVKWTVECRKNNSSLLRAEMWYHYEWQSRRWRWCHCKITLTKTKKWDRERDICTSETVAFIWLIFNFNNLMLNVVDWVFFLVLHSHFIFVCLLLYAEEKDIKAKEAISTHLA